MFKNPTKITGTLEVLSPLHVGDGGSAPVTMDKETVEVATIVRDHRGRPCIPGSTIKGVLRSLVKEHEAENALFGTVRDNDGTMGLLIVRAALKTDNSHPSGCENLPHWDREQGTYIDSHVTIDRDTGTAMEHRLFHRQMVPAGTKFDLRLILLGENPDAKALLQSLLKRLSSPEGVAFGGDQSSGYGRIRLKSVDMDYQGAADLPLKRPRSVVLDLRCDGPYLTLDTQKKNECRKSDKNKTEEEKKNELHSVFDSKGRPVLKGSQLAGVLRSVAAWLDAINGTDEDNRDKIFSSIETLSPTERLFGVNGFRGMLTIDDIETKNAGEKMELTSVSLDQFSMAPRDGALFTTIAYVGCHYRVRLSLDSRAEEQDCQTFDSLLEEIKDQGLMLGHGTSKGFGWFTVSEEMGGV